MLLLVRALTAFYLAVGAFAAASLVSLLGAALVAGHDEVLRRGILAAALAAGSVGVGGLVCGSALLVWESGVTLRVLTAEAAFVLGRHRPGAG